MDDVRAARVSRARRLAGTARRRVARALAPARRLATAVLPYRPMRGGRARLDAEYRAGAWSYLHGLDELGRFSVVAGYCRHLKPGGRVLEIGCGEGILAERLDAARTGGYLGVDISEAAIGAAQHLRTATMDFVAADAETYVPPGTFDVIVFNESLEYFRDPVAVVGRHARRLAPDGVILVSMFRGVHTARSGRIWKRLRSDFHEEDRTEVTNSRGLTWVVAVLEPRR